MLRSPWGDPVLSRRRFLQTLGLNVSNVEGDDSDPRGPHLTFRMRVRLDADFGIAGRQLQYVAGQQNAFVPGLQAEPVDLMYGYFDARNLAGGLLGLRVGRQYVVDSLGWWSFDGALARVQLPVYVAIEAYGGFEQRGGLPLSTPRFEREGVWRGDRTGLDGSLVPEFVRASIAPACGAVVESWGLKSLQLRAAYRKVWNTGSASTRTIASPNAPMVSDTRVSSERFGGSGDLLLADLGNLRAGAVFDLYASLFSSVYSTLDIFPIEWLTVGIDADRFVPTFDADSIWNWFSHYPMTTWTGRTEVMLGRRVSVAGSGGVRWVQTSQDPASYGQAGGSGGSDRKTDLLGRLVGRYGWNGTAAGLSGLLETGERGRRQGADLFAEQTMERRFLVLTRLSLYDWKDEMRPERSATSFGYVLGAGYAPGPATHVRAEWEHDTNRLVGQRYRVMAYLQILVTK